MLILHVLHMNKIQWLQAMREQTTCVLLLVYYAAHNMVCAYIARVLLVRILQNFLSDSTGTHVQMSS